MAKVRLYGETSGYVDLKAPDVAGDVTITLPNATGAFATEPYVDAAIAAIPVLAGIGSNVVQTVKTDTFSTTSATFVDVTGMTATITPTSDTSKILVVAHLNYARSSNEGSQGAVYLRLTGGGTETYVGDTATQLVAQAHGRSTSGNAYYSWSNIYSATPVYLASPATTSAVTIKVQMASTAAGTSYFNIATGGYGSAPSSITLIEVAA